MRNAKKTLSLVMIAIFTTFIVLSGMPAGAVTTAQAKAQVSKATAAVVKVEKTVKVATFVVTTAQTQLTAANKEVAKVKSLGKTYAKTYTALNARTAAVAKKIAARKAAIAKAAAALAKQFANAEKAVAELERAVDPDNVDLVGDASALATAQGAVTAALEYIELLDKDSANYKGLMARVDLANSQVVKAMEEVAQAQADADAAAAEQAAKDAAAKKEADAQAAAETAVKAVEDAVAANNLVAAAAAAPAALTAVDAVTDATAKAAFQARLKVAYDKTQPAVVKSVTAIDGTITVNFDKKPLTTPVVADFTVTKAVNAAAAAVVTPSGVTVVSDTAVTLAVPVVAATTADQSVVYNVAYTTGAAVAAAAYTVAKLPTLAVTSVTALNAKEIKVVYNQPVYATSAEIATNYSVYLAGSSTAVNPADVATQDDGVSVVIQLASAMTSGATYKVNVAGTMDKYYQTMTSYTDTTKIFVDGTAPVLKSASYTGSAVKLTFDEPVVPGMTIKVDGAVVTPAAISTDIQTYTATVSTTLSAGSHSVVAYNVADFNGNTASILTGAFTTVADTTAPSVTSVAAETFDSFYVTFSEAVKATSGSAISTANVVVAKGNHTYPTSQYTVGAAEDNGDGTYSYLVTMLDTDTTNPLYASTETSSVLTVTVKNYMDNASYVGASFTGTATLTTDSTAPYVVASGLNTKSGNTLMIKFSEALGSTGGASKIVVKTADSIIVTPTLVAVDGTNAKYLDITLPSLTSTVYTISLLAGAAYDPSGNANAAATTTYDNSSSASAVTPVSIDSTTTPNAITITFAKDMSATAVDLANYTLDGAAFPAGTVIGFYGDKQTVRITLPSAYFSATSSYLFGISKNVVSDDGTQYVVGNTTTKVAYSNLITFYDNVKPVMSSAKFVLASTGDTTTNTIDVTFNELIKASDASDFQVTVNGVTVAVSTATAVTSSPYSKVVRLVLASYVNVSQATTVKLLATSSDSNSTTDTKDVQGNTATTGTVVTVAQ